MTKHRNPDPAPRHRLIIVRTLVALVRLLVLVVVTFPRTIVLIVLVGLVYGALATVGAVPTTDAPSPNSWVCAQARSACPIPPGCAP